MTQTQNIRTIIAKLMRGKRELELALKKAEEQNRGMYEEMIDLEENYMISGEDEEIGQKLDEVYDEYSEAVKAMGETEDKLKSIKEAIEALRKAVDAIEWLGL